MAATEKKIVSSSVNEIQILKWKVKKGSMVFKESVLALYEEKGDAGASVNKKLKASESGTVAQIHVEENSVVNPGSVLLTIQPQSDNACIHPTIMKDMCADCGMDLRMELGNPGERKKAVTASVAMVHSIPELIVSQEQALELGRADEKRLLQQKKLVLLVDLDQTLIHTTNDNIPANLKDVKHFQLWHGNGYMWYHTRFRPYTDHFLQAISQMYELHICTFGVRMYAHIVARMLDPEKMYFSHRILSRDECFDALSKTANLKALFPCGDKMVGIIDDREDVWNFAPNLVHVKPYRFFQGTADINAPPGLTKSEHDNEPLDHKIVDHSKDTVKHCAEKVEGNSVGDEVVEGSQTESGKDENSETKVVLQIGETTSLSGKGECDKDKKDILSSTSKSGDSLNICGAKDNEVLDPVSSEAVSNPPDDEPSTGRISGFQDDETLGENLKAGGNSGTYCPEKSQERVVRGCDGKGSEDEIVFSDKTPEVGAGLVGDKNSNEKEGNTKEVEWDDEDDHLLHLQEILTRIHKAYYEMYEQSLKKGSSELPDLKNIIPYVKKKVLKGVNIVFSGMFPLNMAKEKSRAYNVAKSLGANVHNDIIFRKSKSGAAVSEATTHLVAAKPGTSKHKTALKAKNIQVVNGDWLWACNERWEFVEEKLFTLSTRDDSSKSLDSPECGSPRSGRSSQPRKRKAGGDDRSTNLLQNESRRRKPNTDARNGDSQPGSSKDSGDGGDQAFVNSYNPLYSFSDEDIEFMDKEVDEIMDEDDGSSEETDEEREVRVRKDVLGKDGQSDSDSDSLAGDFPRGWKMRRKSFSPQKHEGEEKEKKTDEEDDEETENELERYQKNMEAFVQWDSESESNEDDDSIGSVDDEIAEAVEKEFLGSL